MCVITVTDARLRQLTVELAQIKQKNNCGTALMPITRWARTAGDRSHDTVGWTNHQSHSNSRPISSQQTEDVCQNVGHIVDQSEMLLLQEWVCANRGTSSCRRWRLQHKKTTTFLLLL